MESEWNSRCMEIYIDVCFEDKLFFYFHLFLHLRKNFSSQFCERKCMDIRYIEKGEYLTIEFVYKEICLI